MGEKDPKTSPSTGAKMEKSAMNCRPSDLPVYAPTNAYSKVVCHPHGSRKSAMTTNIEESIKVVRVEICAAMQAVASHKNTVNAFINDGIKQTKFARDYLNQEDNTLPRAGAIAVGGLAGLIFGLRGGLFRRLIYTGIGSGAVASVCYPKEAEMYVQKALVESQRYTKIGYNFAYGIKPGDEGNAPEWPKFPTSIGEFIVISGNAYDSVKSMVLSEKKKN